MARALTADGQLVDSYAAIVNGKVITVGDVLRQMQPAMERLSIRLQGPELAQRLVDEYQSVRNELVDSELILLDFESKGGNLPDRAIEDHVNSVIHDRFNNDRAEFLRALAAERLTFAEWRKQMKDQLVVQMMLQQTIQSKILVTPFDVNQAYALKRDAYSTPARLRLRTLAIEPGEGAADRARDLRARIDAGEIAFDDAANAHSAADSEWYELASLNDAIRNAVSALAPGAVSEPVELAGNVYLVQLQEKQDAHLRPLDEVAPEIERELRRAEFDRLRRIWLDSLRAKYFVQLYSHDVFN